MGKVLRYRESYTYLVHMCLTISYVPIFGVRKMVVQIPSMDTILMGYWMTRQVRTMMSSVMYKSKLRIVKNILRRVLMMQCEMFLRSHLRNTRRIDMIDSGRGRFGGLWDEF